MTMFFKLYVKIHIILFSVISIMVLVLTKKTYCKPKPVPLYVATYDKNELMDTRNQCDKLTYFDENVIVILLLEKFAVILLIVAWWIREDYFEKKKIKKKEILIKEDHHNPISVNI